MKVPNLINSTKEEAIKTLEEKKIKYHINNRITFMKKRDIVYRTTPKFEDSIKKDEILEVDIAKINLLPIIIIGIILLGLIIGLTSYVNNNFINVAPYLSLKASGWATENTVYVSKDARVPGKLDYYMVCINEEKDSDSCEWTKTKSKSIKVSESGVWYVYFKAISKTGKEGRISKPITVYIDNNPVDVSDIDIKKEDDHIEIELDPEDINLNNVRYYFKINDGEYLEFDGNRNSLNIYFESLDHSKDNVITIYIIDEAGNEEYVVFTIPKDYIEESSEEEPSEEEPEEPKIEIIIPSIDLNDVPASITVGEDYILPSHFDFGKDLEGIVYCINNETDVVTSTKDLGMGKNYLSCSVINEQGNSVTIEKEVDVDIPIGDDEEFDGWIRMNLYYPENSTDWEWRLGDENVVRDGSNNTEWEPYTGPILVKLDDVSKIYIRYKLNDQLVTVSPSGKLIVDIIPDSFSIKNGEKTNVKLVCDSKADTCEYRINNGDWITYEDSFEVPYLTMIEARVTRNVTIYDGDGNEIGVNPNTQYDSVWISEEKEPLKVIKTSYKPKSGDAIPTSNGRPVSAVSYAKTPSEVEKPSEPTTYLAGPTINLNPSSGITESVNVSIEPEEEAREIYYAFNYGNSKLYNESFNVTDNVLISAYYIRQSDGKKSATTYRYVQNIRHPGLPYVRIDVTPTNYLSDIVSEATVKISGSNYDTLEYSFDGKLYFPYTNELKVNTSTKIYARGTNSVGDTIETTNITTRKIVVKDDLYIEILADPSSSTTPVDKTTITINYDEKAEEKYYRVGYYGQTKTYTGPFDITVNDTVYAFAKSANGEGYQELNIDFLTTGAKAPSITLDPVNLTDTVKVIIDCRDDSVICKYKIDGNDYVDYTEPFDVTEKCKVTAYKENSLGQSKTASRSIDNITYIPKYTQVEKDEYYILKVNYPDSSKEDGREYKWTSNGTWKTYDSDLGILLIKKKYSQKYRDLLQDTDGLTIVDDNGKTVIYTNHYYFLDQDTSNINENLFMRWDTATPTEPTFVKSNNDWVASLNVGINYDRTSTKKMYRVIDSDGNDTGWKEYKGAIKVTDSGTTIYAKSMNSAEVWSNVASITIDNIDNDLPIISNVTISSKGSSKITTTVIASDPTTEITKYYFSLDKEDWKLSNTNSYTFKGLTTNTEYTIYVKVLDQVDHVSEIKEITAKTSMIGEITYSSTPSADTWSTKKTITINYPEDIYSEYEYQYSLDLGETWLDYTESLEFTENNQVIIGRVVDGDNIKVAASFTTGMIDTTIPTISLDGLPDVVSAEKSYNLPSSYTDGPSGSTRVCKVNDVIYTKTEDLPIGNHTISCTITTGAGNTTSVSKEIKVTNITIKGESLLDIVNNKLTKAGYYDLEINNTDEIYSAHYYLLNGDQHITENTTFGDANDCATGTTEDKMAQNMVIVKINGDLEIDPGVTVGPYYNTYGGPKGFLIYVTGKLINNGTIDNSHGAYAYGQDVYLWKNADGTYEYVPAVGASGGAGFKGSGSKPGNAGSTISTRSLGGGGTGFGYNYSSTSGSGGTATSYSGGPGGGGAGSESSAATAGSNNGGSGGNSSNSSNNYNAGAGAGNPPGKGTTTGAGGTGGLLVIYADSYVNNGMLTALGSSGGYIYNGPGGASGGGSINIFTNQITGINSLGVVTDSLYNNIIGITSVLGGQNDNQQYNKAGIGGAGTVNIGEIRDNQYYDLKTIIEQDKENFEATIAKSGESILSIVKDSELESGYWIFKINNETYGTHIYVLDGNQHITENTTFGDAGDCASGTTEDKMAQNMVIVKVNGDLEIDPGVTVGPYYNTYGGPKGFLIYVTGKLINNGTINNSHGAYAYGQDVYLWKNADGTYEYIPAIGASGGAGFKGSGSKPGNAGSTISTRSLGGGGTGFGYNYSSTSGSGGTATSYSGGPGGGGAGSESSAATAGSNNGGLGGNSSNSSNNYNAGAGAGNPPGKGTTTGAGGTGGLLVIYADSYVNNGMLTALGSSGGYIYNGPGGASGGGSINIFTNQNTNINSALAVIDDVYINILGTTKVLGGQNDNQQYNKAGIGGAGTVNIGEIRDNQYYDLKNVIEQDIESYQSTLLKTGDSILSIVKDSGLESGYWNFKVNGEMYNTHVYTYNGNQVFDQNMVFGDANDCATGTTEDKMAKNMVIVKVNGDLTINSGVTVRPYYDTSYGGPKGFLLYVTGKLTNNGTIDNSHGAYAYGQDVYLWKNADGTYEYVPAVGASGGAASSGSKSYGIQGGAGTGRQTGGGASGANYCSGNPSGTGGTGTSYSGGSGGGANNQCSIKSLNGSNVGGSGGTGNRAGGGAGNPGVQKAQNGTGGLLIIFADQYENNGTISANGYKGGEDGSGGYNFGGGSSGGGSINIFSSQDAPTLGNVVANGGIRAYNDGSSSYNIKGAAGGAGTVTYTQINTAPVKSIKKSVNKSVVINNPKYSIINNEDNTKSITIYYNGEYIYEYSLDFGNTWYVYSEPIVIDTNTTIFARTVNNGTILATSTLTITGFEEEGEDESSPSEIIPPVIIEDNSNEEDKSEVETSE